MPCLLTAICHFKDEIEDLTDVHSQQIRKLFFRFFQRTIERGNKLIYRKFCSTVSERNSHAIYLPRIVLAACHVGSLVFFFFFKACMHETRRLFDKNMLCSYVSCRKNRSRARLMITVHASIKNAGDYAKEDDSYLY